MQPRQVFICVVLITFLCAFAVGQDKPLVPNSETAVAIAKVILKPIYGQSFVDKKQFTAVERDGLWVVKGRPKLAPDKVAHGGTVEVRISASDARVIYIHLSL